jgi:hypothetical protein
MCDNGKSSAYEKVLFCRALPVGFSGVLRAQEVPETATDVRPLLVGMQAPAPAGLVDDQGTAFYFWAALVDKPTVLVFYRGHW